MSARFSDIRLVFAYTVTYVDNIMVRVFMYLHTHYLVSARLLLLLPLPRPLPLPLMQPRALFLRGCSSSSSSPSPSLQSSSPSSIIALFLSLFFLFGVTRFDTGIYIVLCSIIYIHVDVYIHGFIMVYIILLTSVGAADLGTLLCGQYIWIIIFLYFIILLLTYKLYYSCSFPIV